MLALIVLCFNFVKVDYDMDDFEKLYSLAGEWSMPYENGELVESWVKQYNKKLKGESYILKDEVKKIQENMGLVLSDGRITFSSVVSGKNNGEPVLFGLVDIDKNKIVFENKEHDFPQRITYDLRSATDLVASIEGQTKKGYRKFEYKYKKKIK